LLVFFANVLPAAELVADAALSTVALRAAFFAALACLAARLRALSAAFFAAFDAGVLRTASATSRTVEVARSCTSRTAVLARSCASRTTAAARFGASRTLSAARVIAACARAVRSAVNSRAPLAISRNSVPGRNAGTRDAGTLTEAPVAGLRAVRAARSRRSKTPKPVMATFSPRAIAA
jgi:putative acetyltransferase